MRFIIDEELKKKVVSTYKELQSGPKTAEICGIGETSVFRILSEFNIERADPHSKIVQDRKKKLQGEIANQAANDYANGLGSKEICEKYKCCWSAVKTVVRDAGIKIRPLGGKERIFTEEEKQSIKNLYINDKLSQSEIARLTNTSQSTIRRLLVYKMNINLRDEMPSGEDHHSWKGGRILMTGGYIGVLIEPTHKFSCMANTTGYIMEHRLVMAKHLDRPLTPIESVHHKDGCKTNNSINNLQLRHGKHGSGIKLKCRTCGGYDIIEDELS